MEQEKLYLLLSEFKMEHKIKFGRDALFNLLSANDMLVKKRKRFIHTTQSFDWLRKYENLIKNYTPQHSNEIWVSDITYWRIADKYVYISLITDSFSHKIVGYNVAETLEGIETIRALEMALQELKSSENKSHQLIHHSDRGIQYCQHKYVKLLKDNDIQISMTQSGDPLENAIAERINGIIKDEYLLEKQVYDISEAKNTLKEVVELYNNERPHLSIGNKCPEIVHKNNTKTEKLWKKYNKTKTKKDTETNK